MMQPDWTPEKQEKYLRWRNNIGYTNEQIADAYERMASGLDERGQWLATQYRKCATYLRKPHARLSKRLLTVVLDFLIRQCCLCERTALYRVNTSGFCDVHKAHAIQQRTGASRLRDKWESESEPLHRKAEANRKRNDHARRYGQSLKRPGVRRH